MNLNWRQSFKHWTGMSILLLTSLILISGIFYLKNKDRVWQISNTYKIISELYHKDTYGGETPEETYDLFIQSLEDKNIELASKYFVTNKQNDWLKTLSEFQKNNFLEDYIEEIKQNRNKWTLETADDQKIVFKYKSQTIFVKDPNNIWKIEQI